jgi:enoyl-CoA hydratase
VGQSLVVENDGGLHWITINRPEKLNALNASVLDELGTAFEAARSAAEVRVVALTGAGEKAFVAGADIAELAALSPVAAQETARKGQRLFAAIESFPKPVIAAVNGFALGGGCELAMACHLRIAARHARFGQPEVKLGLIPGYGGTQRLPRLVGRGRALELLLTGGMLDAPTAHAWGLVNRLVEGTDLREATRSLAGEIAAVSPLAVRRCLEAVAAGLDCSLERGQDFEASLFGLCFASQDMKEGTTAFLEKRAPSFRGD